jgi:hypothetical protein
VKGLTRKELQHAQFGNHAVNERKHVGQFRVEKLMPRPFAEQPQWVLMSAGEADQSAAPGKELALLIRRATVIEGTTRIVQAKTGQVVWPREQSQ